MSERLYSDIVPLLSNGDPKVRRYALDEMIRQIDRLERTSLLNLFGNAADDEDEEVAKAAKYGLSILFQRDENRSMRLTGAFRVPASMAKLPKGFDYTEVRAAAEDVLKQIIENLSEMALDVDSAEMGGYAVKILGRFAFHGTLETLYKSTFIEDRVEDAIRAISQFDEEEVLFLLKKFLKRFSEDRIVATIIKALSNLRFPEIIDIFEEYVKHSSALLRATTAQALGKCNDDKAEKLLTELLEDPESEVVARAVDSLAILGRPASAPAIALLTAGGHDKKIRSRATTALGFIRSPESKDVLCGLLDDQDHRVAANAVDSLRFLDLSREEIIRYISPLLKHPNNRVKANAILSLRLAEEGRAMGALRKMLQSPIRTERASAAYLVGEIRTIDAVKWLVTLINTELESTVLSAALNALEKLDRPEAKPCLNRLFKHPNANIRAQAIRIFSKMGGSSAMRQLEGLLYGERIETVRSSIVAAMGNVCDTGNYMVLTRVLQDNNERVVANAIEALDRMGSLEVTPFISPFLTHPNNRIRANTIVALWKLGDLKVSAKVYEMLSGKPDGPKRSAMHVLKQMADFLQLPLLAERPLLLSALVDRYKQVAKSGSVCLTEASRQYAELFKMEEEESGEGPKGDAQDLPGIGELLRERSIGMEDGGFEKALAAVLGKEPENTVALYMARRDGNSDSSGYALPAADRLRSTWRAENFLPGLMDLLNESKARKDLDSFLADYLALFECQAEIYSAFVKRSRDLLNKGETASVQRIVKMLVEKMPLQTRLHKEIGDLAFAARDHDFAFSHLLKAFVQEPYDYDMALKLCSCALRTGRTKIAESLVDLLMFSEGVSSETTEKARRFRELLLRLKEVSEEEPR